MGTRDTGLLLRDKTHYKLSQLRGRLSGGLANRPPGLWIGRAVRIAGDVQLDEGVRLNDQVRLTADLGEIRIGRRTVVGLRTEVNSEASISIGGECHISFDVLIMDTDHHTIDDAEKTAPITIGSNVWIAARACVLKGVTIGDGAVIGAGAIVTSDVPPGYLAVGVPARPLRPVKWRV